MLPRKLRWAKVYVCVCVCVCMYECESVSVYLCVGIGTNRSARVMFVLRGRRRPSSPHSSLVLWVRRWLIRPIFALNSLLQCGQGMSGWEEEPDESFRRCRLCCSSSTRTVSKASTPVVTEARQAARSCATSSQEAGGMLQRFRDTLRVSL